MSATGLKACTFYILETARDAFIISSAGTSERGAFMGFQHSLKGISGIVREFIGSLVTSSWSVEAPFLLAGGMYMLHALAFPLFATSATKKKIA